LCDPCDYSATEYTIYFMTNNEINTALHEIGHKLGLVKSLQLMGMNDHNNPATEIVPQSVYPRDIMDTTVTWDESYSGPIPNFPNFRTQEFRPINAEYLKLILQ